MDKLISILTNLSDEKIKWFASRNGAAQVRAILDETTFAEEVDEANLAYEVIRDFVTWALSHPHPDQKKGV